MSEARKKEILTAGIIVAAAIAYWPSLVALTPAVGAGLNIYWLWRV